MTQDTLFASGADASTPLAERMRPRSLDEIVGQGELLAPGKPLRTAIESDRLRSMILWGPPGSGKTTLARLVARHGEAELVQLSAVTSGLKDARAALEEAVERRRLTGRRTVLFLDEIHRYNKAQQDAFLPHVERGDVVLVGATTENPSFGVIAPLLSRARVHVLAALDDGAIESLLRRALTDDPVLGPRGLELEDAAARRIAAWASGDARLALGLLEAAAEALPLGETRLGLDDVAAAAASRTFRHDKAGDQHYDLASAFIKSMRDSDPDAAIYWMVRALAAGEDPLFLLRRMVIFAAEDVGMADPRALQVAVAAQQAFERLGQPEGEIPMAQACVHLATAPKSNSAYLALKRARRAVEDARAHEIPKHLRNAVTGLMRREGHGSGYRYAHDEDGGVAGMTCLPEELAGERFYEPTGRGLEKAVRERLERLRALRAGEADEPRGAGESDEPRGDIERVEPRGGGERVEPRGDGERVEPRGGGERGDGA